MHPVWVSPFSYAAFSGQDRLAALFAFGRTDGCASKAGMLGFSSAYAHEVARRRVTVNTISPGGSATGTVAAVPKKLLDTKIIPQIPIGRLGRPVEIAALVVQRRPGDTVFITGAYSAVNGGQHMQ